VSPDGPGSPAVAYLVSQYPALSHAFIEREILALRAAGVGVTTFTVRRCPPEDLMSPVMVEEDRRTTALLGAARSAYLGAGLGQVAAGGVASLGAGLVAAVRAGRGGVRPRIWQAFYLVEALRLVTEMRARGLRHVHVHFANNGADIARLAVALGNGSRGQRQDAGPRWTWSFSMHGPTEFETPQAHGLAAKTRAAAFVACISRYAVRQLAPHLPETDRAKLAIVHMGVDPDRFPGSADVRTGRSPGPLRVLFVGRLVQEKGPDVLLRALARLTVPFRARIVGAGPLGHHLRTLAEQLGITDRVEFPGGLGQGALPGLYAWADVFCLPSHREGVPVVLMEAMATELPVVTTSIAGIPELVTDRVSGRLLAPGDPSAVATVLDELARDASQRRSLGRAGRQVVLGSFTPGPNARVLAGLLASVQSSDAGQRPKLTPPQGPDGGDPHRTASTDAGFRAHRTGRQP